MEKATFGGGCFWCTEAVFKELKGVETVTSGYAGGDMPQPKYEQVASGMTGHAEVVQVEFDPSVISYKQLVEVFFLTHNPTTMNQQGADFGSQYRSIIFYHNDEQKKIIEEVKKELEEKRVYRDRIVTQIEPAKSFYPAEDNHKDYYARNQGAPYCRVVIDPKISKLREKFRPLLKSTA